MKNTILVLVAVLAVASAVISGLVLIRFESQQCRELRAECKQECDDRRDGSLNDHQGRRTYIGTRFQEKIVECDLNFDGDEADQCKLRATDWMVRELSLLDGLDRRARDEHRSCVEGCDARAADCGRPTAAAAVAAPGAEVVVDCVEGGAPCFKEVAEVCTLIAGPCDNCWNSLCGGGEVTFESDGGDLTVTLVAAAADPLRNPRVLATSTPKGKLAALGVPADIKLNSGERLYLGFSSKEKPGGPLKVSVRRNM